MQLTTNHPAKVAANIAALDLRQQRPRRVRHGREREHHRARAVRRPRSTRSARSGRTRSARRSRCSPTAAASYDGKHFNFPPRNVLPKPRQKPHPPLWVACSQLRDARLRAARAGSARSASSSSAPTPRTPGCTPTTTRITKRLDKLADYADQPEHRAGHRCSCARRPTKRRGREADGATFFQFCLRYYASSRDRERPPPGTVNMWERVPEAGSAPIPRRPSAPCRGGLIGSPETIRAQAAQVRGLAHRPGDPAQPGRPQHARRHLRQPGALRATR